MYKVLSLVKGLSKEVVDDFQQLHMDEKGAMTREELLRIIDNYDGIIADDAIQYDYGMFGQAKKLKVLTRFGVGVDNVNIGDAKKFNVKITNVPGENAESVAEHTIGMMIAASKNFATLDKKIKAGEWSRTEALGFELANKTLGQIGFGNIGKLVAQKCKVAFNMNILVYDPFVPHYEVNNLVYGKKCSFDYVIANSDFISINLPATKETKNMFTIKEFRKMKKNVVIVNTGRGEVIVEEDLAEALRNREIFAAGLDVLRKEPPDKDNPLLKEERVILTPHSASFTPEAQSRVLRAALEDQMRVFEGKEPFFAINK